MTTETTQPQSADLFSYRDGFQNLLWLVKVLGLVILVLTGFLYYYISNVVPQDRYIAETIEGNRMSLVALETPNLNIETVLSWASQAAADILTFGFNNIDERFNVTRNLFTSDGWESFRDAMIRSGMIESVTNSQQLITAILREPPVLLKSGLIKGKNGWIVQVPLILTVRAGGVSTNNRVTARMTIVRMPTKQNPMGIGIENWYSK